MDADRDLDELDRRIAEAIGWADVRVGPFGKLIGRRPTGRDHFDDVLPYSRNLETAWCVVTHLWHARRLYIALIGGGTYYRAEFAEAPDSAHPIGAGAGETPAEGIVRAALDALAEQEAN